MLKIQGLTRYYGKFLALDHLDLTIGDGELHGFVGPNGAGKTTTMRILATLLPASSGTAEIDGVIIGKNNKKARSLVGYMPDFFGTYDNLKAWEYLDFYARCYGIRKQERMRMTEQLLELVGLTDKRDAYVNSLSRGMKQRLCLAHALIHDPKLLILDEPSLGLSPVNVELIFNKLGEIRAKGTTVLLVEQNVEKSLRNSDRGYALENGRIVLSGTGEELLGNSELRRVYLGM